jgi:hypothetical protein
MHAHEPSQMVLVGCAATAGTQALFDHPGARAAMASGDLTAPLAKRYLADIRSRLNTSTKEGILQGQVSSHAHVPSALCATLWWGSHIMHRTSHLTPVSCAGAAH